MQRLVATIAVLLLFAPAATAEGNGTGPETDVATPVSTNTTLLDDILGGVGDAAQGLGDAVEGAGQGIGKGASAVGNALTVALAAVGKGAIAAVQGLGIAGAAVAGGLAGLVVSLGPAMGWLGGAITSGLFIAVTGAGKGIAIAAVAVADGFVFLALAIGDGFLAYAGLVGSMRPEAMPVAAFGTVVGVGAAGSAGAGGWAGLQALKKWGWLGTGLGGMAGFSRISNDELLEHPMRAQIFDVIKTHPGIHASQLAREMDVGWGTITHHLDKLQRAQMVTTRRVNNQKCFFEQGGEISRHDMQIASALKGDTASSIAAFVTHHPMTSQKQMAEALGISPALASFHVKKLVGLGVLEKMRHGKETLLTTSDGLRRVLESADPQMAAAFQNADGGFEFGS